MSTTTKGLRNACPTCLVPAWSQCVTYKGVPTNAHAPRVRGQWPVLDQCIIGPRGSERVGAPCGYCGHSSFLHPGQYTNPGIEECVVCAMLRTMREVKGLTPGS